VGGAQSYYILWVECRIITLCGCSAELSHSFLELRGAVHYVTTVCKGSICYFENDPCQQSGRHIYRKTERWPQRLVPPFSSNRLREFRLADPKNFISQTATFSSYRPEYCILETPKFHLTTPRNFPQRTAGLRRSWRSFVNNWNVFLCKFLSGCVSKICIGGNLNPWYSSCCMANLKWRSRRHISDEGRAQCECYDWWGRILSDITLQEYSNQLIIMSHITLQEYSNQIMLSDITPQEYSNQIIPIAICYLQKAVEVKVILFCVSHFNSVFIVMLQTEPTSRYTQLRVNFYRRSFIALHTS